MYVTKDDVEQSDLVWYGFTRLYFMTIQADLENSVIAVHDPNEIFSTHKLWKNSIVPLTLDYRIWLDFFDRFFVRRNNLKLIKKAKHVVVISREMKGKLEGVGVSATLIRTTTNFPIENSCQKHSLSMVSVANPHVRKNFRLLKMIQNFCQENSIRFEFKGNKKYSRKEYVEFMDKHNVYLCTSFQEGGPLPPMDLMARGGIVLTTPVGQIQDMILDAKNGFVCENYKEFIEKIDYLNKNIDVIEKMSDESIYTIKDRHPLKIKEEVKNYLQAIGNRTRLKS